MKTFFEIRERTLTKGEMKKREKIAKDLPDAEFKKRYGDDWMSVKMGTATNMAKNEAVDPNNHKHVMAVMYNTKNSEEGIAAIKKKFGVDHKKANDMMNKAIDHQTKNEAVDPDETGGEAETHMAMNQVKQMRHYLDGIERMVKAEGDMEEWIQNKMTKATDYLKSVYGYKTGSQNEDVKEYHHKQPKQPGMMKKPMAELSRDTLGSYIKKASDASKHRGMPTKKVDNRYSGVAKASKRIDKMEKLDDKDKPFVSDLVKKLRGGSKTHAKQADDLEKAMKNESINEISQKTKDRYLRFAKSSRVNAPKDYKTYKDMGMPHGMKRAADTARKRDRGIKLASEAMTFAVSVEGLPQMFLNGNSPGEIKQNLRKMFKQPSMIQSVKRVTPHDVKKVFRMKAQGKDDD